MWAEVLKMITPSLVPNVYCYDTITICDQFMYRAMCREYEDDIHPFIFPDLSFCNSHVDAEFSVPTNPANVW